MKAVVLERRFDEAEKKEYHVRVGVLKVNQVSPMDAVGRVIEQLGPVKTADDIRVVYEKAAVPGFPPIAQVRAKTGKMLLTLLVLFAVVGVLMNRNAAIDAITSIQARSTSVVDNGVQVQWTPRSNLPTEPGVIASEVLGYVVYRSENPFIEGDQSAVRDLVLGGSVKRFIDDSRPESATTTIATDDNGTVTISRSATTTARQAATGAAMAGPTRQGYASTVTVNVNSTGTVPGVHYYYAVQSITKFQVYGGASGGTIIIGTASPGRTGSVSAPAEASQPAAGVGRFGERASATRQNVIVKRFTLAVSDWSGVFGPVTPLARPSLSAPANVPDPGSADVSPFGADFSWDSVAGGDTYRLQVANNIRFQNAYATPELSSPGEAGGVLMSQNVNIFNIFGTSEAKYYYWRVGVRYSGDRLRPVPDGYVWSQTRSFRTVELPPPPPGG